MKFVNISEWNISSCVCHNAKRHSANMRVSPTRLECPVARGRDYLTSLTVTTSLHSIELCVLPVGLRRLWHCHL